MPEAKSGQVARKHERIRRLADIWARAGFKTSKELATRFDVTEQTICNNLKIAKEIVRDHFKETLGEDLDLRMLQLETLIEEGFRNHEVSRQKKVWCRSCNGRGRTGSGEESEDCERCDGEGFWWERQPGDSNHLALVLKTIQEVCKLRGHYPEKPKKEEESKPLAGRFEGADPELVLRIQKSWILIRQGRNGRDENEKIVDAEFEETNEKGEVR